MINLAITNLGMYNEGRLCFKWIGLPISEEDLQKAYKEINIGGYYEEVFISDYETDFGLEIGEYDSISQLNEIAQRIEDENLDTDMLKAILETTNNSVSGFEEAARILENGDYIFLPDVTDAQELGEYVVQNGLFGIEIPESLEKYIDYEAIGRDFEMDYDYVDGGALCIY